MQVTRPLSWIALGGVVLLVASVVVWGFVGSIPTKVQAQGMLIKPGGVFDVFTIGSGRLVSMTVAEGERVAKGQVIATIDHPDIRAQIEAAKAELSERAAEHVKLTEFTTKDLGLRDNVLEIQGAKVRETIVFAEQRLAALRQQIASQETLLEKGLITNQTLLQSRQEYFAAQDLLQRSRNDLEQLPLERLTSRTGRDLDLARSQLAMNDIRRRIDTLEEQHRVVSTVVSPYSGNILEIKHRSGDVIGAGVAIVSLQLADQERAGLQAIIYVPPNAGKNVTTGLQAEISPTTAPREEFGFMLGKVSYVSEFPATTEGMMQVLSNQALVQTLSAEGPPFAVYAELLPDSASKSGYRWSSPKGAALNVNSGTLCNVTLTVRSRRPVEMVIPILREYTGL
jgi:HlyD family secretion protein